MKAWICNDNFGFSIWTEEPKFNNNMEIFYGSDDPYNTKAVYVSESLITLLGLHVAFGEKVIVELTYKENLYNMEYSAGIIIWCKRDTGEVEFFVSTPGGPQWVNRELWNFPKGHVEENETPFQAAYREFAEETSVSLKDDKEDQYVYEGLVKQRANKSVYVYSHKWDGEKLDNTCFSNTFEEDGHEYPEIGKYAWMTFDEIKVHNGIRAYYTIFEKLSK